CRVLAIQTQGCSRRALGSPPRTDSAGPFGRDQASDCARASPRFFPTANSTRAVSARYVASAAPRPPAPPGGGGLYPSPKPRAPQRGQLARRDVQTPATSMPATAIPKTPTELTPQRCSSGYLRKQEIVSSKIDWLMAHRGHRLTRRRIDQRFDSIAC